MPFCSGSCLSRLCSSSSFSPVIAISMHRAFRGFVSALLFFFSLFDSGMTLTCSMRSRAAPFGESISVWGGCCSRPVACFLLTFRSRMLRSMRLFSLVACLLLITAQFLTLKASPSPKIDVFTSTATAARHLISGRNPYPQKYADIYNGAFAYEPSFPYWPGVLYWVTPFEYFFGDIRIGFLVAEILSAFCIALIARRRGLDEWSQWGFSLAWLSFPVCLFIIEQSWIDTLLTLMLSLSCLCLMTRRWWASGLCLGYLLATKQYAPLVVFGAAGWVLANYGARTAAIVTGTVIATFTALTAPFLIADAQSFFHYTVALFFGQGFRADSLSLSAFLLEQWGVRLPELVGVILTFILMLVVGLRIWQKRLFRLDECWLGLCLLYLVFFLFGRQAFCNYYYFIAFLLLLSLLFEQQPQWPVK